MQNATMLKATPLLMICVSVLIACSSPKQLFETHAKQAESQRLILQQYFRPRAPIIQAGDKLTISIWGHDDLSIGSINTNFNSSEATGRWLVVDNEGEVNLPQIGRVKIGGYDVKEVNYLLEQQYSQLIKDPIINVKILSHYVTILGEVNTPGRYQLDNERVSLVEVLGTAGGLTPYARNDGIKVIRLVNGQPVELDVDFTSLVAYAEYNVDLQPDDVVYVGATGKKFTDEKLRRVTNVTGILTGIALVASVFLK